jgi:hypothetical protein
VSEPLTRETGLDLLRGLVASARVNLALYPDDLLPTLFVSTAEKVEIIGLGGGMPETRAERRTVLYGLGRAYARDADWVAFVADAWIKRRHPASELLPPTIKGKPGTTEAIVSMWLARNGTLVMIEVPYDRVPSDGRSAARIVFAEEHVIAEDEPTIDYDSICATVLRGGGWRP